MATLAENVNRNLMALRLIERAMHEPTGWTVRYGGITVPVQVIVSDAGVTFWAAIPAGLGDRTAVGAAICHNNQMLWAILVVAPGEAAFEIEVTITATSEATAAA
jgi:hypothetical protein